ncbi:hypothetical protein FAZ95_21500 [Trinickia violacea]|uniref:Uncharacterized protein n=1 Tax=Trinickia violacea TaxID=2571746 RepID=A0A4P8IUI6_9BURK|nr:hypothetical protein FAZ95_21500 [Trinickia violacea]
MAHRMASLRHLHRLPGEFSTKLSTGWAATGQFLMRIQNLAANVMFYFKFAPRVAAQHPRRAAGASGLALA